MNHIFQRVSRRTLLPALALGLALGASGLATAAAHAEPSGGSTDTAKVKCTYANMDYSVGAKIPIYGSSGKVVSYQVCQKDGTWKRILVPVGPAAPISGGVLAP